MTRTLTHSILLVLSLLFVVDQFLFAKEETTVRMGQQTIREERPRGRGIYRWKRWNEKPGPQRGKNVHAEVWHVAMLADHRCFQYYQRDNGLLREGDTVHIKVSCISGRVLEYRPLGDHVTHARSTVDALTEIAPIPVLMTPLLLWILLFRPGPDARMYLHYTILLLAVIFLLGLIAMSWPTVNFLIRG